MRFMLHLGLWPDFVEELFGLKVQGVAENTEATAVRGHMFRTLNASDFLFSIPSEDLAAIWWGQKKRKGAAGTGEVVSKEIPFVAQEATVIVK